MGEVVADVLVHDVVQQLELALSVGVHLAAGVEEHQHSQLSPYPLPFVFLQQLLKLILSHG